MAQQQPKAQWQRIWYPRIQRYGTHALYILAGKMMRLIAIFLALLISMWLLYIFGWKPMHQAVLPTTESLRSNPKLQEQLLQDINNGRIQRNGYTVRSYARFKSFFVPQASPQPTPGP